MKKLFLIPLTLCFIGALYSCDNSQDLALEPSNTGSDIHSCTLKLSASMSDYDISSDARAEITRATSNTTSDWADSSCIYVRFICDSTTIGGTAVYDKTADTWNISYKGNLPNTTKGTCCVYYFNNAQFKSATLLDLDKYSTNYGDTTAQYNFNGAEICINASLTPTTSRLRFQCDSTDSVICKGIKYQSIFDLSSMTFTYDSANIKLNCNIPNTDENTYYTPYIYGELFDTTRILEIKCSKGSFRRTCNEHVLNDISSGFIKLPNKNNYNGWTKVNGIFVDLGLSVYWFSTNIGATSMYDIGDYYQFGALHPAPSTYVTKNFDIAGNPNYDVARSIYGEGYSIPTHNQWIELWNNCTRVYCIIDGVRGYRIQGKNGNEIFLPFGGRWLESAVQEYEYGYYWTSTSYNTDWARYLKFTSSALEDSYNGGKQYGRLIRPVLIKK